ncbi:MAG: pyruvate dehydrogenase (acetyl-transferring) E1 component subunit alpha [Chloroflexi bacterium]|nr:pyruvate dehydrogenase (acetyl-transferring) E1 component subunit alpha [Chloroflexota bacterium]
MARKTIDLPYQIEYLSIFDEEGNLDEDLEPDISDDLLLDMHRCMLLSRRFDERMLNMQRQGRIGTFALVQGQEASQVGSVAVLQAEDWMVPSYRETAAIAWRGRQQPVETMVKLLLYNAGFYQGSASEREEHNFPTSVPVSSQILHAVGLAYGSKYREAGEVVMVYFGDGATSEGDFHEAMNFGSVFQTPTIFVCQNNQWAISIPREEQTESKTLAQKALGYGMPGIQVDGNDLLAVYAATQEAIARARKGDGPTMIECVTYRLSLHTTADDPTRYREDEEVERWAEREPLTRIQNYLKQKELLDDKAIEKLEDEIKAQIKDAVEEFENRSEELKDQALTMFEHIYAEIPAYLQEQRDELAIELEGASSE